MILQQLYQLAEREKLLVDPAFKIGYIAAEIQIGLGGEFQEIRDVRPRITLPSRKTGEPGQVQIGKGYVGSLPKRPVRYCGPSEHSQDVRKQDFAHWRMADPATPGVERPAVFLADTLGRVLPIHRLIEPARQDHYARQRSTFWRFVSFAAQECGDAALKAIVQFGQQVDRHPVWVEAICRYMEQTGLVHAQICTFVNSEDQGQKVLEARPLVRKWWREFYEQDVARSAVAARKGFCQVTGKIAPLADTIKYRVNGLIRIGCRADAYAVTSSPAAESHGWVGSINAMLSEEAVDGFTTALNALIANRLQRGKRSSLRLGNTLFLYWTRQSTEWAAFDLLESPDPQSVRRLLNSPYRGRPSNNLDPDHFYCLTLSGNSARIIIRGFLDSLVSQVQENLDHWFQDLRIIDIYKNEEHGDYSLFQLAEAMVGEVKYLPPHIPQQLLDAAVQGRSLPQTILAASLKRLQREGLPGFTPVRLALIKLCLIRHPSKGQSMSESLDLNNFHPAYLCGRLLAVFERLQYYALGEVNTSVVNRFYGMASTAPGVIFPRLFKLAEHHLAKLQGYKPGLAVNMQKELESLSVGIRGFPFLLSLCDQGQFALGFYHQRAKYRADALARKADLEDQPIPETVNN